LAVLRAAGDGNEIYAKGGGLMPLDIKATIKSIFSGPISSAKASGKKSAAKASGKRKTRDEKLRLWQERLQDNRNAYQLELDRFDRRARYYEGENLIEPLTAYDTKPNGEYYATSHVRNIVAEMIEAQISSVIPHPKVAAKRQEDEERARVDYEELPTEITTPLGQQIGGMTSETDAKGLFYDHPTRIPLYKVDKYPLVIHKNISVYGRLMGASDVDAISDHQNTTNRLHQKIIDRSVQSGSIITVPADARIRIDSKDGKVIRLSNPAEREEFGVYNLDSDVSQQRAYLAEVYEEARQRIGITDSYQGRRDTTAQSGVAKQFAAAQSAGRLESKRRMKEAVFADLYERIFKLKLAYADTGVSVLGYDAQGAPEYLEFSRYDFLRQNPLTLKWEWNDDFTFSIDPSGELAGNRQSMWQETIALYQAGAFGNPSALESLVVLWSKLERASYPDAASTMDYFQRALGAQQQAPQQAQLQAQQQMQQQAQLQQQQGQAVPGGNGTPGIGALPPELTSAIEAKAREAAWRDAQAGSASAGGANAPLNQT
jgi:hypothetical protein